MPPLPADDIAEIHRQLGPLVPELRDQRILITGATGFFGRWLLETLLAIPPDGRKQNGGTSSASSAPIDSERLPSIVALSRDPARFISENPHLGPSQNLCWVRDSVVTLASSSLPHRSLTSVIHLATVADNDADPALRRAVIVEGTQRVLDVAASAGVTRFLFTSTGAVPRPAAPIGHWTLGIGHSPSYPGAAEKLEAESLCLARPELGPVIARCYSFVGPGLPLDGKFAFGNFLRDALAGRPIEIAGDGTPVRSYLYASDLTVWLLNLLIRGDSGRSYEIGSANPVSIRVLAETIDRVAGGAAVLVRGRSDPASTDRYLPASDPGIAALGLRETVDLETAIRKTAAWERGRRHA